MCPIGEVAVLGWAAPPWFGGDDLLDVVVIVVLVLSLDSDGLFKGS